MTLVKINAHIWVNSEEVKLVELFPLTALVKVTLKTGEAFEHFVLDHEIEWAMSPRHSRGREYAPVAQTREVAFHFIAERFVSQFNRAYEK